MGDQTRSIVGKMLVSFFLSADVKEKTLCVLSSAGMSEAWPISFAENR